MKRCGKNHNRCALILAGGDGTRLSGGNAAHSRRFHHKAVLSRNRQHIAGRTNVFAFRSQSATIGFLLRHARARTPLPRIAQADIPGKPGDSAREARNGSRNPVCTSAIVQIRRPMHGWRCFPRIFLSAMIVNSCAMSIWPSTRSGPARR